MRVSYQWLSEYVELNGVTADELAESITRSGIEVDGVELLNQGVENVVVGYVKACSRHPNADKLRVCIVDAGTGEDLQIVCGASNVAAGQKVPVALVGAKLPGDVKIKRAKLRGVESQGMICSAKELGLNAKLLPKEIQEGILVLPEETEVGRSILDVLSLDDQVLELDLTPNRSDCLSMIGTAYEVAAVLNRSVKLPAEDQGLTVGGTKAAEHVNVTVEAEKECYHYAARLIENVKIGPSPLWMQNRLMAAGIRPINNVVDVTNYVMLEYGQPLHAFDADAIEGGHIHVRLAKAGETITTLDGQERQLDATMLLITNASVKPVAIAGVMGGANSQVTNETTRIILESAWFDGGSVRKTSRQLGLRSESSSRFEKGVNPDYVIPALNRAASLICQLAGGTAAEGIVEVRSRKPEPVVVKVTMDKINALTGMNLDAAEVARIWERLQFAYEQNGNEFRVQVPHRRGDITLDVDLVEEVARLYGYDHIPVTFIEGETTPGSLTKDQFLRREIRKLLSANGLNEVINYSLVHPAMVQQFPGKYGTGKIPVSLAMPMSEDHAVLRTSLIPQLAKTAAYNRNRNESDVAIFEIGKVYLTEKELVAEQPEERLLLSILLTGNREEANWLSKPQPVDFYDLKGVLERLFAAIGLSGVQYRAVKVDGFHPGRTAEAVVATDGGEQVVGIFGQLHPSLQKAWNLDDTYVAELDLDLLSRHADFATIYRPLPKFPAITRDLAVVVPLETPAASLESAIRKAAGELLESAKIFDVYQGEKLGEGRKSVALSLVFRHPERTLTDEEANELHARIVSALEQTFGAELRK